MRRRFLTVALAALLLVAAVVLAACGDLRPGRLALSRGNHIDAEEAARIAAEVDAVVGATAH